MDGEFNAYLGRFGQRYRMEDFFAFAGIHSGGLPGVSVGEDLIRAMVQILSGRGDYVLLEQGYPNKNTFIRMSFGCTKRCFTPLTREKDRLQPGSAKWPFFRTGTIV